MLKVGSFVLAGLIILAGVFWAGRLLPQTAPAWQTGLVAVTGFVVFSVLAVFWVLAIEVLVGTINALLEVSNDTERLTELLAKGLGAEDTQRLLRGIESVLLLSDEERRRRGERGELADLVEELGTAEREQHWNEVHPLVEELIRRFPDADVTLRYQVQRDEIRQRALEQDLKAARREVEQVSAQGNWTLALLLVDRLERRYPGTAALSELRQQLARQREAAEAQELEGLVGLVETHIATGDWMQAQVTAERLARRFPQSPRVVGLVERIHSLAEQERQANKLGLGTSIKDLIQERQWQEAVEKTRLYLERYPDGPEAKGLRDRLPWLEANAEAGLRDQLLDLVKQAMSSRRYDEAYRFAAQFLERYPESKDAEVIRRDLDQLRERARETSGTKPAPTEQPAGEPSPGE
jgi:tetratricopeptide (TPR) repeat protein